MRLLSRKHQIFLMMLLERPLTRKDTILFKRSKGFYSMVGWMQKNDVVESVTVDENGTRQYSLTIRGSILALAIDNMSSGKSEIKKYFARRSI